MKAIMRKSASACAAMAAGAALVGACGGSTGVAVCEPIADEFVSLYNSTVELSQSASSDPAAESTLSAKFEDIKRQGQELVTRKESSGCSDTDLHSLVEKRDPEAATALLHG